jgi:hypothetical protein
MLSHRYTRRFAAAPYPLAVCALAACTGASGDPGPAGPPGEPGADAPVALVRSAPLAPSADCPAGGWRIDTGLDDDGDGVLGDDEVDATADICDGAPAVPPGPVIEGSFVIRNHVDVRLLDGVETITRDLVIEGVGLRDVALPTVRSIGGGLRLARATDVARLELPALEDLGALQIPQPNRLVALRLPALTDAGTIALAIDAPDLDLTALTAATSVRISSLLVDLRAIGALTTVEGELAIDGRGALASLAGLEHLASAGSLTLEGIALAEPAAFPDLVSVAGALQVGSGVAGALAFPALTSAGAVEIVGTDLTAASFEVLRDAGEVRVSDNDRLAALRAPALVGSSGTVLTLDDDPVLVTLDLRALRTAARVWLVALAVPSLELGALETVAGDTIVSGHRDLTRISLPALARVGELLSISYSPQLVELSLPALASVGRLFVNDDRSLCVSVVEALIAQLRSRGWAGEAWYANLDLSC